MATDLHGRDWKGTHFRIHDTDFWIFRDFWFFSYRISLLGRSAWVKLSQVKKNQIISSLECVFYCNWNKHSCDAYVDLNWYKSHCIRHFNWYFRIFYGWTVQLNALEWPIYIHSKWLAKDLNVFGPYSHFKQRYHWNCLPIGWIHYLVFTIFGGRSTKWNRIQKHFFHSFGSKCDKFYFICAKKVLWNKKCKKHVGHKTFGGKNFMIIKN